MPSSTSTTSSSSSILDSKHLALFLGVLDVVFSCILLISASFGFAGHSLCNDNAAIMPMYAYGTADAEFNSAKAKSSIAPFSPPDYVYTVCNSARENSTLDISCKHGPTELGIISNINFASFGTPFGECSTPQISWCHSGKSSFVVEQACLGQSSCRVQATAKLFGDPCINTRKYLTVDATCQVKSTLPQPMPYTITVSKAVHLSPFCLVLACLTFILVLIACSVVLYGAYHNDKPFFILFQLIECFIVSFTPIIIILAASNFSWMKGFYSAIDIAGVSCNSRYSGGSLIMCFSFGFVMFVFNVIFSRVMGRFSERLEGPNLSYYCFVLLHRIVNCLKYGTAGLRFTVGLGRNVQSSDVALLIKTQSDQFFKELVVPVDSPALNSYIAFCEAAANRLQFPAQNISHVLKNGDILVSEDSDVVRLISGDRIQIVVRSATVQHQFINDNKKDNV